MSTQTQQLPFRFRLMINSMNALAAIIPGAVGRFAFDLFCTPRSTPAHQRRAPHAIASATPLAVRFGSQELRAWEWGKGERTVMLVHGWESESTSLAAFILPLVECGYRVIALDGPAHGDSPGNRLNLIDYVAAMRSTIAQHGPVQSVIAHSFGGGAALFALGEPGGLGNTVERVVTIGAPARLQDVLQRFGVSLGLTGSVLNAMYDAMRQRFGRSMADFDPARVQKTTLPLMVVHDRADVIVPFSDAEDITRIISHAQALFTEGLGHRGILKNREVISHVIRFIDG
jgi:pimeloyl-ACP methyl ester carboxylesterase